MAALDRGYDLLLEKPIAHRREDTLAVREAATAFSGTISAASTGAVFDLSGGRATY